MTDYETPTGDDRENKICFGNATVEEFSNCIEENTRDFVKCSRPHHRSNRIYKETVLPFIQPLNGSIGFNETSSMDLLIDSSSNTSYTIWFVDRNFAFNTMNPLVAPRTFLVLKPKGVFMILYLKVKILMYYYCNFLFDRSGFKD